MEVPAKQAIDDLVWEERKTEALKLAKDEALSDYNHWFLWILPVE